MKLSKKIITGISALALVTVAATGMFAASAASESHIKSFDPTIPFSEIGSWYGNFYTPHTEMENPNGDYNHGAALASMIREKGYKGTLYVNVSTKGWSDNKNKINYPAAPENNYYSETGWISAHARYPDKLYISCTKVINSQSTQVTNIWNAK